MLGSPRKFADLLTEGISLLKSRERKTIRMIQEELGEALGLSYHTIEHWRKGKQLPAQANYVEQLAREFIKRGKFDQAWVVQFFASAGYKNGAGQFGDQLFSQPTPGVAPQLKETLKPTLSIVKPFRSLIGRDNDVKKLSDALIDPNAKRMIGIDGVGGIGKSALAHELIDLCQQRGCFQHIIWVNARHDFPFANPALTWETVLDAIAQELGLTELMQASTVEREARIRALLRRQTSLIVLDNLETATPAQGELLARVQSLLGVGKLLATSRQRFRGDLLAVHLKGLTDTAGRRFLQQEARDRGVDVLDSALPEELNKIVEATGGSPLAMKLIVGQLNLFPLEQVLTHLQQAALFKQGSDNEYADLFRFIYLPSWTKLTQPARDLLVWLAIFPQPTGGDFAAIRAISAWDDTELSVQIQKLWQVSLVETNHAAALGLQGNRYFLHSLTHYFVKSEAVKSNRSVQEQNDNCYAEGAKRYIDYFLTYLLNNPRNYTRLDLEVENLSEALRLATVDTNPAHFVRATHHITHYLLVRGSYGQAQQLLHQAEQVVAALSLYAELTTILAMQGRVLIKQGLLEEAHRVLQIALDQATKQQDPDSTADVLQVTAELELNLGDFTAATANLQKALAYAQKYKNLGRLTQIFYLLGRSACFTSEFQQAHLFLNQAAELAQKLGDTELMMPIFIQLAALAGMQAEFVKAESYARKALKVAESLNHREWMASALKNLAGALIAQGRVEDGATYARQGVDIAQQIGQLELASGLLNNLAVGVSNYGYLHNEPAKIEEGLRYYLEGLEIVREQGNRERIRSFLTNAATILTLQGHYTQAESYLMEADALAYALESEWSTADTKIALGKLLVAQAKFKQAAQAFQIALENAERAAMPELKADALWGLGKVAEGEKNYVEATRLGQGSLQLMEEIGLNSDAAALRDWLNKLPAV